MKIERPMNGDDDILGPMVRLYKIMKNLKERESTPTPFMPLPTYTSVGIYRGRLKELKYMKRTL